jgi:hypothetical protein
MRFHGVGGGAIRVLLIAVIDLSKKRMFVLL